MKKLGVTLVSVLVVSLLTAGFLVARGAEAQTPTPDATQQATNKAFLGVQISELTPAIASRLGVGDIKGVVVTNVLPLSPAEQAGLRRSDVITAFAGKTVTTPAELSSSVAGSKPGDKVTLTIQRGSQSLSIEATLGTQSAALPNPAKSMPHGFHMPKLQVPPLLKELQEIAPVARFNHFLGGTLNFTDKDGKPLDVTVTPGVVKTSTADSITYTPNGKTDTVTVAVTVDVTVVGAGGRTIKPEDIKAEERIVVLSVNGTVRQVRVAGAAGIGHMLQEKMGQLRKGEVIRERLQQKLPHREMRGSGDGQRPMMGASSLERGGGPYRLQPRPMAPSGGSVQ